MIKVKRLYELENKFKRHHGWSGADGVFSIAYNNDVFWYFSDTFIGDSSNEGIRLNFELINNSLAISNKELTKFDFIYNTNPTSSIFVPSKGYFWLQDYILIDDELYISALNMENDIFSDIPFCIKGLSFIKVKMPFNSNVNYQTFELDCYQENIIIGTSIIKEENYYYLFGYKNEFNNKQLIIARTKDLLSNKIEYLHSDSSWSESTNDLRVLKDNFAAEFKVFKLNKTYYIAYTKHSIGKDIYLIKTNNLFEPYQDEILLYSCEDHQGNIICYNSKIQTGISNEKEFIISYNVNTLVNEEHRYLDIYRPRFIRVSKEDIDYEFKKM